MRLLYAIAASLAILAGGVARADDGEPPSGRRLFLNCPLVNNLSCEGKTATLTRATAAWYISDAGVLTEVASGVARHSPTRGLLVEEPTTNPMLHNRDGSNAVWNKSNATATKTATGKDGVANSATRLTATAANGTIIQPLAGLSNIARVGSLYVRRVTGTGTVEITCDGGTSWATIVPPAAWDTNALDGEGDRFSCTKAASTTFDLGLRLVTSADAVEFDLGQAESNANGYDRPLSPIVTTGSALARNADNVDVSSVGIPIFGVVSAELIPQWASGGTVQTVADQIVNATGFGWTTYVGADERQNCATVSAASGTDNALSGVLTWTPGTRYRWRCSLGVTPQVYRDAALQATSGTSGVGAIGGHTVVRIGRFNGNNLHFNGWISWLRVTQ